MNKIERVSTRRSNATSREIDHREALQTSGLLQQMIWCLKFLGICVKFLLAHGSSTTDLSIHSAAVSNGLDNVT